MASNGKLSCWELAAAVLPHCRTLILFGASGTGKTEAAIRRAREKGDAVFSISLTPEMPAAELRGHYLPVERGFAWVDGPALAAYRRGVPLVINELDHASDDAMSFLLAILDDPEVAYLTLPNGETVRPGAGFCVFATLNGDPDSLPPALRDRFPVAIHIDSVHPEAIASLPKDLQAAARATIALPAERRISFRAWKEFARLRELIGEERAARAVFGARAGEVLDALRLHRAKGGGER